MDTNTMLGIALIFMQTGWGIAAWKSNRSVKSQLAEHTKQDEHNFHELRTMIATAVKL